MPPAQESLDPVYFFQDPETKYCSQWYLLRFEAPLPTRDSIMALPGSRSQEPKLHTFECNEQYMMYSKAVLFNDADTAADIAAHGGDPKKCKALGRNVANFDRALWDQYKEEIVEEGNWWKFTKGEGEAGVHVREKLLATGDREIVEASPFDRIWGIGYEKHKAGKNRSKWGQNLLGKALVRVRTRIREQTAATAKQTQSH